MKIVFVSNYFSHHQSALAAAFDFMPDVEFYFVENECMEEERKAMGWGIEAPSYVLAHDEQNASAYNQLIDEADVAIIGNVPKWQIERRLKEGKLTFFYSERIYKQKSKFYKYPLHKLWFMREGKTSRSAYLLCASAYTAADYAKTHTFTNRGYKWGYFPETKTYDDVDRLIASKKKASLLWVARFINMKHPEVPVEIARRLKNDGYTFELNIIGTGELEQMVTQMVADEGLNDCVHLLGTMKPDEVRIHMEQSEIFLFTSDRGEGWGAVLNESMNSGCAVVASHAIGSVPYLIKDTENGYIYRDGDVNDLYTKVKFLLENEEKRTAVGRNAYRTMITEWNAKTAAVRFVKLAECLLRGEKNPQPFAAGICSKAEIVKDDWYTGK